MYDNKVYASVTNEPCGQSFSLIAFKIIMIVTTEYFRAHCALHWLDQNTFLKKT